MKTLILGSFVIGLAACGPSSAPSREKRTVVVPAEEPEHTPERLKTLPPVEGDRS